MIEASRLLTDAEQVNVSARIDHDRNACGGGGGARAAHPLDRIGDFVECAAGPMNRVFEVDS